MGAHSAPQRCDLTPTRAGSVSSFSTRGLLIRFGVRANFLPPGSSWRSTSRPPTTTEVRSYLVSTGICTSSPATAGKPGTLSGCTGTARTSEASPSEPLVVWWLHGLCRVSCFIFQSLVFVCSCFPTFVLPPDLGAVYRSTTFSENAQILMRFRLASSLEPHRPKPHFFEKAPQVGFF